VEVVAVSQPGVPVHDGSSFDRGAHAADRLV
jgi:hypothetical protein